MSDEGTVEALRYDWPQNVLEYETRFWGGLTLADMMGAALPAILAITMVDGLGGIVLAGVAGIAGFLVVKKWDGLGNRSFPLYLAARAANKLQGRRIEMPVIIAGYGASQFTVRSWDGTEIAKVSGDGHSTA